MCCRKSAGSIVFSPTFLAAYRAPQLNMKHIFKKIGKSNEDKHPSLITDALGSSPEAANLTLTIMTSTTDPKPSIPAIATATSIQVIKATGVTVSGQLHPSHP